MVTMQPTALPLQAALDLQHGVGSFQAFLQHGGHICTTPVDFTIPAYAHNLNPPPGTLNPV